MMGILGGLQGKFILTFIVSVLILTFWEYIVGVLLEKIFKTKYWDYSNHKINFQGRICLTNSILWGFLGIGFINYINPFINNIVIQIPSNILKSIVYSALIVVIIDTIISIIKINSIRDKLDKIDELREEIKLRVKQIRLYSRSKTQEKNKSTANIQMSLVELKAKRNRMMRNLYRYVYRMKKAFPAMNTKEFTEILSKKYANKRNLTKDKRRK